MAVSGLFPVELLEESVFAVNDSLSGAGTRSNPNRKAANMYLALIKALGQKRIDALISSLPKEDTITRCGYDLLQKFVLATRKQYEAYADHLSLYHCFCGMSSTEECPSCTSTSIAGYGYHDGDEEQSTTEITEDTTENTTESTESTEEEE